MHQRFARFIIIGFAALLLFTAANTTYTLYTTTNQSTHNQHTSDQIEALQAQIAALENDSADDIDDIMRLLEQQFLILCQLQEQIDEITFIPRDIGLSEDLQEFTHYEAVSQGVEPDLVFALMYQESRFQVDMVHHNANGSTDLGVMQINSCNWGWLSDQGYDVRDPYGNISAGIYMLAELIEKYPVEDALAAYNCGEVGMRHGGGYWYAMEILDSI